MRTKTAFAIATIAIVLASCGRQLDVTQGGSARTLAGKPTPVAVCDNTVKSGESIQAEINACATGASIDVLPGVYRETITPKSGQTINGTTSAGQAVIKGSNVVTSWTKETVSGQTYWSTPYTAKTETDDRRWHKCQDNTGNVCLMRDQAFVTDATGLPRALKQQASLSTVTPDGFYVGNRKLYIQVDPATAQVEVSARDRWVDGTGGQTNVTINGFAMMHATNPSQSGAIQANSPGWRITNNNLSYANGAAVSTYTDGGIVSGNEIHHNGQLGMHGGAVDLQILSNKIHDNNTERFNPFWEAGGTKWTRVTNLTVKGNESYGNDGPGLWCDIDCNGVLFDGNTAYDNTRQGIHFEISSNATITNNRVYRNGFMTDNYDVWPEGAGILVQNSSGVKVSNNDVLYNADGIGVIQTGTNVVQNVSITGNTVIVDHSLKQHFLDAYGKAIMSSELISFVSDGATGIFDSANKNFASGNRYHFLGALEERWVWGAGTRVDTLNEAGPDAAVAEWNAAAPSWWAQLATQPEATYFADTSAYSSYSNVSSL